MSDVLELLADQEETLRIIQNLASYIIYMYPGTISLYVMNFLEAKSIKETTAYAVKIFAISYLYNIVLSAIIDYKSNIFMYNAILIMISFAMPLLVFKIKFSKGFSCVCSFLGIRTCVTGVPFELIKSTDEAYTCVKVYLKDSNYVYIGYMQNYEYERNSENFLILTGYRKYVMKEENGKEKCIEIHNADECNEKVYIKCAEIKVIEKISEDRAENEIYRLKS